MGVADVAADEPDGEAGEEEQLRKRRLEDEECPESDIGKDDDEDAEEESGERCVRDSGDVGVM